MAARRLGRKDDAVFPDRYHTCAGGKCLRSLREREGAFSRYSGLEVNLVGFANCGGCPGGNVEYAPAEMVRNGAEVIHLAAGLVVGYPPCPRLLYFPVFIRENFGVEVVIGTHPIPRSYFSTQSHLGTWDGSPWREMIAPLLTDEKTRLAYD